MYYSTTQQVRIAKGESKSKKDSNNKSKVEGHRETTRVVGAEIGRSDSPREDRRRVGHVAGDTRSVVDFRYEKNAQLFCKGQPLAPSSMCILKVAARLTCSPGMRQETVTDSLVTVPTVYTPPYVFVVRQQ